MAQTVKRLPAMQATHLSQKPCLLRKLLCVIKDQPVTVRLEGTLREPEWPSPSPRLGLALPLCASCWAPRTRLPGGVQVAASVAQKFCQDFSFIDSKQNRKVLDFLSG